MSFPKSFPRVSEAEIQAGGGLSLSAAGRLSDFPGHRGNGTVDPSTVFPLAHEGDAVLPDGRVDSWRPSVWAGGWLTSRGAVARFVAALTTAADSTSTPSASSVAASARPRPASAPPRRPPRSSRRWAPDQSPSPNTTGPGAAQLDTPGRSEKPMDLIVAHGSGDCKPGLLPQHLADLRKSGLRAEIIAASGVYSETDPASRVKATTRRLPGAPRPSGRWGRAWPSPSPVPTVRR